MVELKKDLKRNEQKVEKVLMLMQQTAFEKEDDEDFSSDDNEAQESGKSVKDINAEEVKHPHKALTTTGLKTIQAAGENLIDKNDRSTIEPKESALTLISGKNDNSSQNISAKK